ncbi:response regulator transcription factor [Pontibacter sp. G13]|uniref:response regulator transcription factor n=1 Tax=Pontibacter sp. G13 TaxID=3074898 RepID=UPI00288BF00D|nr:response regulator transcription factor [Pontibacter sp. G13]WNJ21526.1 response regulator transcription factor [Pontibacter sp. G13]
MNESKPIQIVLVDDHQIILDGLMAMFKSEPSIDVLRTFSSGEQLLETITYHPIDLDIILMDIEMKALNGIETARKVKEQFPHYHIIMLSQHFNRQLISRAIEAGADGYLPKNIGKEELLRGIQEVYRGRIYFQGKSDPQKSNLVLAPSFTPREKEIMCLLVQEKTNSEIASSLGLKATTVTQHRQNIMSKLGVGHIGGIVHYALQAGLCN